MSQPTAQYIHKTDVNFYNWYEIDETQLPGEGTCLECTRTTTALAVAVYKESISNICLLVSYIISQPSDIYRNDLNESGFLGLLLRAFQQMFL